MVVFYQIFDHDDIKMKNETLKKKEECLGHNIIDL